MDEIQTITFGSLAVSGTYTLTFNGDTTTAIAWNADAGTIQAVLEALGSIGTGNISVSGDAYSAGVITLTFQGTLASTNVSQTTCDASGLSCAGSIGVVSETTAGTIAPTIAWNFSADVGSMPRLTLTFTDTGGVGVGLSAARDGTDADDQATIQGAFDSGVGSGAATVSVTSSVATIVINNPAIFGSSTGLLASVADSDSGSPTFDNTAGTDEVQTIPQPVADDGTFTVTGAAEATSALAWHITQADLQTAINALSDITAAGGVVVSGSDGGPWVVTWNNPGTQSLLTADGSALTAADAATAATTQEGGALTYTGSGGGACGGVFGGTGSDSATIYSGSGGGILSGVFAGAGTDGATVYSGSGAGSSGGYFGGTGTCEPSGPSDPVGGNLAAIETGPCSVSLAGNLLGSTVGGCTLTAKPITRQRMVDEFGENPVETIHQGDTVQVKVTLTEKSYRTLQTVYMFGASQGTGVMGFGRRPGLTGSAVGGQLIIHPLSDGESTADDVVINVAVVVDSAEVPLGQIQQDVGFQVTFQGLLATSLSDGAMLGYIGTSKSS